MIGAPWYMLIRIIASKITRSSPITITDVRDLKPMIKKRPATSFDPWQYDGSQVQTLVGNKPVIGYRFRELGGMGYFAQTGADEEITQEDPESKGEILARYRSFNERWDHFETFCSTGYPLASHE